VQESARLGSRNLVATQHRQVGAADGVWTLP